MQGAGFQVSVAGCRVQGAGCRVQGAGCRVQGAGCRVAQQRSPEIGHALSSSIGGLADAS